MISLPKFPCRASWSTAWVIRTGAVGGNGRAGVGSSVGSSAESSVGSSAESSVGLPAESSVGLSADVLVGCIADIPVAVNKSLAGYLAGLFSCRSLNSIFATSIPRDFQI